MPSRSLPHHRATPTLTGGRDSERTPCLSYPGVYDALVDVGGTGRSVNPEAVEAARNLCATCVLRMPEVADRCIRDALERGEQWVGVLLGRDTRKPPTKRDVCGKPHGPRAHTKNHERPCEPCRIAGAKRAQDRRRARREAAA